MNPEFLKQLEIIRDNLAPYAEEYRVLWAIIHAIDACLEEYGG